MRNIIFSRQVIMWWIEVMVSVSLDADVVYVRGRVKKSRQTIFFSSDGCIYTSGSVYIKYEPLSLISPNNGQYCTLGCTAALTWQYILDTAKLAGNLKWKKTSWDHFKQNQATKWCSDFSFFYKDKLPIRLKSCAICQNVNFHNSIIFFKCKICEYKRI